MILICGRRETPPRLGNDIGTTWEETLGGKSIEAVHACICVRVYRRTVMNISSHRAASSDVEAFDTGGLFKKMASKIQPLWGRQDAVGEIHHGPRCRGRHLVEEAPRRAKTRKFQVTALC